MFFISTSLLKSFPLSIININGNPSNINKETTCRLSRANANKTNVSIIKIIIGQTSKHMRNRYRFYQELRQGYTTLSNMFPGQTDDSANCEDNYQNAKEILMSIPDQQDLPHTNMIDIRAFNNGSDITRWNQQHLLSISKENQKKRRKMVRKKCRHISSENTCIETQPSQIGVVHTLKKELNKLQLPLKEKIINSDQFKRSQCDKERSKTRNEIKLEIINSKHQLVPTLQGRRKTQTENNCQRIVKVRTEGNPYQRIRRKGLFTIDLQMEKAYEEAVIRNLSQTREKAFFLKAQGQNCPRLRENSIHLFAM